MRSLPSLARLERPPSYSSDDPRASEVDADYVRQMLADIVKDQDLSRYIL